MRYALLILVLLSGCAAQRWTKVDTAIQVGFTTSLAVDYVQTRNITADGRESNPIMGSHGERVNPTLYFASVAVMHFVAARYLPPTYRRLLTLAVTGTQAHTITVNARAGYGMEW